jgi:cystathionine beta-lyase
VGLEAAYRGGEAWLEALLRYLEGNRDFAERFIRERVPSMGFIRPEGTYLALLDCRQLGMEPRAMDDFFLRVARVYFDSGSLFGPESRGFQRLNFGCRRETLTRALEQIERAVGDLQ